MIRLRTNQFKNICRLCSSLHPHLRCISSDSIISMIEDCAPVHVSLEDGLPQFICEDCFGLLNKITTFRKKCVESEKEFFKSIDGKKNEFENEANYLLQAKLEVTDSIKTEIVENHVPNADNLSNYKNSDSETLINLKNKQSDTTEYKCEICSKVLISFKQIEKHLKDEHRLKPMECKIKFYHDSNLSNINKSTSKEENKIVALPERTEGTKRSNNMHKLTHTKLKTQTKSIQSKRSLNIHRKEVDLKSRTRKQIVKHTECQVCHKKMRADSIYLHMANIHGDRKTYSCSDCSKTFLYERSLRKHYKIIHQNIPVIREYLCHLCGFAGAKKTDYDKHLTTHSTERPYKCDQCGHDYRNVYHLRNHIKAKHLNIKPFVCSYCGHAFAKKRHHDDHVRTHTGEKPFKCNYCEQAFGSNSGLFIHNRTHHRFK